SPSATGKVPLVLGVAVVSLALTIVRVSFALVSQIFLDQRLRLSLGPRRRDLGRHLALALFLLGDALHRDHLLGLFLALRLLQTDQAHALRVAADGRDAVDGHADQLVGVGDETQPDHLAVALGGLDGDDALAAAVLGRVVGRRRALAVALLAHRQQGGRLLARDDRHADDVVGVLAVSQPDAAYAARRPPHRADVLLAEADRPAVARAQQQVRRALGDAHADQRVVIGDGQRDDAGDADVAERVQRRL